MAGITPNIAFALAIPIRIIFVVRVVNDKIIHSIIKTRVTVQNSIKFSSKISKVVILGEFLKDTIEGVKSLRVLDLA